MPVETGQEAPGFSLRDQNGDRGDPLGVPGGEERRPHLLPVRLHRHLHQRAGLGAGPPPGVRQREHHHPGGLVRQRSSRSGSSPSGGLHVPAALRRVAARRDAQEYGVFLEERVRRQRGTFVVDKAGVVRWSRRPRAR